MYVCLHDTKNVHSKKTNHYNSTIMLVYAVYCETHIKPYRNYILKREYSMLFHYNADPR